MKNTNEVNENMICIRVSYTADMIDKCARSDLH
jgi:hypothetical protein